VTLLRGARRVAVGTHLNPDGDAVGSALAFSHWLDKLGVEHDVYCHNEAPGYLGFLAGVDRIQTVRDRDDHDVGVALDLDALDRLGRHREAFEGLPQLVVIDHHVPHESPGNLRIVDVAAPATAGILTDLWADALPGVDRQIAQCLLVGLVTDTGSFRFPNTTAHALHQAAWLVERGADVAEIADFVYLNKDDEAVRLLGIALNRVKTASGGRLAWATLPLSAFQEAGAREEHNEGIVNEILSMRSVLVAAVLRESAPGRIKGSLRSKGDIDVSSVAKAMGGGGHRNAAGLSLETTMEKAERLVVGALKACLASS
jgi:bifunctional oligoribonuclease and PAP phosphatase NrnA